MLAIPEAVGKITYQEQYRKCGKHCSTCRSGPGHGKYLYAYYRENGRLRCKYLGKAPEEPATS